MLILLLTTIPLAGALAAWLIPSDTRRPLVLPVVAGIHLLLVIAVIAASPPQTMSGWIHLDAIGKIFLLEFSILFAACAFYSVNYLQYRKERNNRVLCTGFLV